MWAEACQRRPALPPRTRRLLLFIFNGTDKLFCPLAIHEVD